MGSGYSTTTDILERMGISTDAVSINDEKIVSRIINYGSLGLGEGYIEGMWDCDDMEPVLTEILKKRLRGELTIELGDSFWYVLDAFVDSVTNPQHGDGAYEVGRFHYDLDGPVFKYMLDKTMSYSCGYWGREDNLYQSQINKMSLICKKLHMGENMVVLDIGCGWGGLARYLHDSYGAKVVGITISEKQYAYCVSNNNGRDCTFKLMSYNDLTDVDKFDRIISVGMMEHVGYKNYRKFMEKQQRALKPNGLILTQTIVGSKSKKKGDPWFEKYVFPNSMVPSMAQISSACEELLIIEDVQNIGMHYYMTLIAWAHRFNSNIKHINAELQTKHSKSMSNEFIRMWNFYLLFSAALFHSRTLHLYQIVISKYPEQSYVRPNYTD